MLYLPLDKIISQTAAESNRVASESVVAAPTTQGATTAQPKDAKDTGLRARDLRDLR
jgi:hypothetical protein